MIEDKETDTVFYGLRTWLDLLAKCNPNIIEMLGTRDEDIFLMNETAKYIREHSSIFLNKRVYESYE